MHSSSFPIEKFGQSLDFALDAVHSDFDQQAASYSSIDQTYTQLTEGQFEGRLFSADLGAASIYIEYCNQAIEKEIVLSPDKFSFSIVMLNILVSISSFSDRILSISSLKSWLLCISSATLLILVFISS